MTYVFFARVVGNTDCLTHVVWLILVVCDIHIRMREEGMAGFGLTRHVEGGWDVWMGVGVLVVSLM